MDQLQQAFGSSPLMTFVLAAGALGTAAFGIVDGLKWFRWVGEAGFGHIEDLLEAGFREALVRAYGKDVVALLRAQYRAPNSHDELVRTLRQGVRLGLAPDTAEQLSAMLGVVSSADLTAIAYAIEAGKAQEGTADVLTDAERGLLGRFELAADTRIDAALTLSEDSFRYAARTWAAFIALALALITAAVLSPDSKTDLVYMSRAALLGFIAVPIAPVAKDVASGIAAAAKALSTRK